MTIAACQKLKPSTGRAPGRSAGQADVSVIVPTFNEERNLPTCLGSVLGWARRVFVVDSLSSDRTCEIARNADGVDVFEHRFRNYCDQWNWALDNLPIDTEWILKLDADETLTDAGRREMQAAMRDCSPDVAGFAVWRKFIFMGKWLKRSVGRCYDVRLWRRGKGRLENRSVNEHLLLDGKCRTLTHPLIHEDKKGLSAWVWRHNRYSTMEAQEYLRGKAAGGTTGLGGEGVRLRRWLKMRVWPTVPLKPLAYFLYVYVWRLGFLDGSAGLDYAVLRAFYYKLIEMKKKEHRLTGEVSSPDVVDG